MILSIMSACFLLNFSPFQESLPLRLEIFNEITTVLLLYTVTCFTNFVPDVHTQVFIGYFFICLMIANMAAHLFFLLRSSFLDCKHKYKKRKYHHEQISKIETRVDKAQEDEIDSEPREIRNDNKKL